MGYSALVLTLKFAKCVPFQDPILLIHTHLISPHLIREGVPHDIDGRTSRPVTPKMTSSVDEPILIPIFSFE